MILPIWTWTHSVQFLGGRELPRFLPPLPPPALRSPGWTTLTPSRSSDDVLLCGTAGAMMTEKLKSSSLSPWPAVPRVAVPNVDCLVIWSSSSYLALSPMIEYEVSPTDMLQPLNANKPVLTAGRLSFGGRSVPRGSTKCESQSFLVESSLTEFCDVSSVTNCFHACFCWIGSGLLLFSEDNNAEVIADGVGDNPIGGLAAKVVLSPPEAISDMS